jgi:hypothetical protein
MSKIYKILDTSSQHLKETTHQVLAQISDWFGMHTGQLKYRTGSVFVVNLLREDKEPRDFLQTINMSLMVMIFLPD